MTHPHHDEAADLAWSMQTAKAPHGKNWSLDFARNLGMTPHDIDRYIHGKKE